MSEPAPPDIAGSSAPSPAPRVATRPLELSQPSDPYFDYCLQPYVPRPATQEALRAVNVLVESFARAGVEAEGVALIERLRATLGLNKTVWGIKHRVGVPIRAWELYFYNWASPGEREGGIELGPVVDACGPLVDVPVGPCSGLPWHMFSVELDSTVLRAGRGATVEFYIGSRNYTLRSDGLEMKNMYTFHRPLEDVADLLERLDLCPHFDRTISHTGTLIPFELKECHRVCVANKRNHDAMYFHRVDTRTMRWFARWQRWPEDFTAHLDDLGPRLEHLLWDVGFDYRRTMGGLEFVQSGIYGTF